MKGKIRVITLGALLILIGVLIPSSTVTGYISHDPIRINSNSDFVSIANSGNGSLDNPWIIEGLEINGTGYGYGIYIENTTEHFILRNCYLRNASGINNGSDYLNSGVILNNVQNGTITNNLMMGNWNNGIFVYKSSNNYFNNNNASYNFGSGIALEYSSFNIINNNHFYNDSIGILLTGFEGATINNNIFDNTISYNWYGLFASNVSRNSMTNNLISGYSGKDDGHYTEEGLTLYHSSNMTLSDNNFANTGLFISGTQLSHYNTHVISENNLINGKPLYYYKNSSDFNINSISAGQIIIANCKKVSISDLTISDTQVGISIVYSEDIKINRNNLINNTNYGLLITASSKIEVKENLISENNGDGLSISESSDISIIDNEISNNYHNIVLWQSSNNNIENNNISGSMYTNIQITYKSSGNTIRGNNISLSKESSGLYVSSSLNDLIENNNFSGNADNGVRLSNVSQSDIISNKFIKNEIGIKLFECSKCNLTNNLVSNNEWRGIELSGSSNNTVKQNTISNNEWGIKMHNSNDNLIYHNNFLNNWVHVFVRNCENNIWFIEPPVGGNYWGGNNNIDSDKDGFGDKIYSISHGRYYDHYPLIEPYEGQYPEPGENTGSWWLITVVPIVIGVIIVIWYVKRKIPSNKSRCKK